MLSLYLILPLLATQGALAAPLQSSSHVEHHAENEARQWGGGGGRNRPNRVRPTQATTQAAAGSVAPAPIDTPAANTAGEAAATTAASEPVASSAADPVESGDAAGSSDTAPAESAPVDSAPLASASAEATGTAVGTGGLSAAAPAEGSASASAPAASGTGGAASSSSGAAAGGGSGGPVGTGWDPLKNKASMDSYVEAGLQWWTNWSPSAPSYPAIEFVPLVHNAGVVDSVKEAMGGWPEGTKYVLSFNEPDQPATVGDSATSAADAVTGHNNLAAVLGDSYSLGCPAVARGGGPWLDEWLAGCEAAGGCKYDFVPYHFYGKDADELIKYSKDFYTKYQKPLWLTEWACHDFTPPEGIPKECTAAQTEEFMKTSIAWFRGEGKAMVARWAWFGAFPDMTEWNGNNMDASRIAKADGTINELGLEYMKL